MKFISVKEAAKILNYSPARVYVLIKDYPSFPAYKLDPKKPKSSYLIDEEALYRWVRRKSALRK